MERYGHHSHEEDLHELVTNFGGADSSSTGHIWTSHEPDPYHDSLLWRLQPPDDRTKFTSYEDTTASSISSASILPRAEKRADDPTTPVDGRRPFARGVSSTPSTLTRLFAFHTNSSNPLSRTPSSENAPVYFNGKATVATGSALHSHLFTRGLLGGRHSDINVHAFGKVYALHRLILDRAPFFASALSEPWLESHSKDVTLHPEDIDPNITPKTFELALKRLYGSPDPAEEQREAAGLFATACWLEMDELVAASVTSLLQTMCPENLASILRLVEVNCYGKEGDMLLAAAKAMLSRDGSEMSSRHWDGISGDIVREIIGGDGFYIAGEWERWALAKKLLDRRLRHAAATLVPVPSVAGGHAGNQNIHTLKRVRFDTVYRKKVVACSLPLDDDLAPLYTRPDIEPLLELLDSGIHYMHLDFEFLQYIRTSRDYLGCPVISEKVLTEALWTNTDLRQLVLNASKKQTELNLAKTEDDRAVIDKAFDGLHVGSENAALSRAGTQEYLAASLELNDRKVPEKFWVPRSDCQLVMGAMSDTQGHSINESSAASILSSNWRGSDGHLFTGYSSSPPSQSSNSLPGKDANQLTYTNLPPFRFSIEFPNPNSIAIGARMYSKTIFYAGSFWNMYILKTRSASKEPQIGVYLNRAEEQHGPASMFAPPGVSVDERIGRLERDMQRRSERHARRVPPQPPAQPDPRDQISPVSVDDNDIRPSADTFSLPQPITPPSRSSMPSSQHAHSDTWLAEDNDSMTDQHASPTRDTSTLQPYQLPLPQTSNLLPPSMYDSDDMISFSNGATAGTNPASTNLIDNTALAAAVLAAAGTTTTTTTSTTSRSTRSRNAASASSAPYTPTLPPYTDQRPTIKTYFRIYAPSQGGRLLSVYESVPVAFNVRQSWGWASSALVLDEAVVLGLKSSDESDDEIGGKGEMAQTSAGAAQNIPGTGTGNGGEAGPSIGNVAQQSRSRRKKEREGKLRFMVVLGIV